MWVCVDKVALGQVFLRVLTAVDLFLCHLPIDAAHSRRTNRRSNVLKKKVEDHSIEKCSHVVFKGRAIAEAISRRPVTVEARLPS
jgi:hypothetical protein